MNMSQVDPADFAVLCVEGKPFDVRRRIFDVTDPDLLRGALSVMESYDGDERLQDWMRMRLKVLDVLSFVEKVEAKEADPVSRRGSRKRPAPTQARLMLTPVQPTLFAPAPVLDEVPAPVEVVAPVQPEAVAPVVQPVDLTPATAPVVEVAAPVAPWVPLVDPRPAIPLKVRPVRMSTFEKECNIALPWVLWFIQRFWDQSAGEARLHRRDITVLARGKGPGTFERWGLDHWHGRAWEYGGALETMAAACNLSATYRNHVLTIRSDGSWSPQPG